MEQNITNIDNPPEQKSEPEKNHTHHHRHHRRHSQTGVDRRAIYRNLLLITGFILIIFSITEENLFLAFSGSILLLLSLTFTDVYKKTSRTLTDLIRSLNNAVNENKNHSHRRHHRRH